MNFGGEHGAATLSATPSLTAAAEPEAPAAAAGPATNPEKRRLKLRPLASLLPYVKRYRGRAIAALGALILASIDNGLVLLGVPEFWRMFIQGVAIVGSGMSFHDLRHFRDGDGHASEAFDAWLGDAVTAK